MIRHAQTSSAARLALLLLALLDGLALLLLPVLQRFRFLLMLLFQLFPLTRACGATLLLVVLCLQRRAYLSVTRRENISL